MNSVQVPREYISLIYIPLKVKNGRDIPLQAAYAMRKSNAATTHLFKLQAEQNFASRIISNTRKFDNVTQILIDLRWLPVKSQLYYRDAVLAFKSMSVLMPPYLASLFLKRIEVRGPVTRNSHLFNVPCFKSATGQKTFLCRTVSLLNDLDDTFQLREFVFIFNIRNKLLREFLTS